MQTLLGTYTSASLPAANTVQPGTIAYTGSGRTPAISDGKTWGFLSPGNAGRPFFVGAIGDSITQKNQLLFDNSIKTAAQLYAVTDRSWQPQAWLLYGAMRSNNRWCAWDFNPGFSGGTSAQILATTLPCFLAYPNGLPDACVILAGTNDTGTGVPTATTIANIKAMAAALLASGVQPILATIPPNTSGTQAALLLNLAIMRLALELSLPLVDFYGALINPANGRMQTNYTLDGTHPTARGAAVMGYKLNQAITDNFSLPRGRNIIDTYSAALALNLANVDPNLLTISGTINTTSSYPNAVPYGPAPNDPTMCTMNNGAIAEPGVGLTMDQPTPNIMGDASTPNLIGNSFTVAGNGTQSFTFNNHATAISYNAGDRIAFAFRIKSIFTQAPTNMGTFTIILQDNTLGSLAGIFYGNTAGNLVANGQAAIGNEAAYPAGDFYGEITIPPGAGGAGQLQLRFSTTVAGATSNVGDSITWANIRIVNLTQAGIVAP